MKEDDVRDLVISNFDKYDESKDGFLDKRELTKFFNDILERKKLTNEHNPEELAEKFINMIDLNDDKKLTLE